MGTGNGALGFMWSFSAGRKTRIDLQEGGGPRLDHPHLQSQGRHHSSSPKPQYSFLLSGRCRFYAQHGGGPRCPDSLRKTNQEKVQHKTQSRAGERVGESRTLPCLWLTRVLDPTPQLSQTPPVVIPESTIREYALSTTGCGPQT